MCCHYQLARSPTPSAPPHENPDDPGPLREEAAAERTAAHEQRSRTHGVVALAMFAVWMVVPWLLAVLMCRRREDRDLRTSGRPGAIRQMFALALLHKHFYEYARDTSKQFRALMRELRQSGPDMTRAGEEEADAGETRREPVKRSSRVGHERGRHGL
jgi:hypothetical protein